MANFLIFTSYIVVTLSLANGFINGVDAARAFFVFGDSLVDNGNNNYLATTARADSPPYGIDFPNQEPTGRQEIGSEPPLPYLSPKLKGDKLLVGANFASAGVGILNDTGFQFKLHDLGARKVLVTGTGSMGCAPAELALRGINGECDVELERAASLYNPLLVKMIKRLNKDIGDDVFIAANAHKMQIDFITNPELFGFATSKEACCGQGPYNGVGLCTPLSNLCENRDLYVFWDQFHPSEKANRIIVQQILTGSNDYMHPMNLSTVLAMDSIGV
ncbi:hypothetical protein TSUD_33190 [Trifolium subterraneum]|uniref:GDSL esterase/lipase n=1 Tax=Trifolium subterraneum TaxID=3900 RepID=A0A2Z6MVT5_TRISU|nr:hypothetical protein TSUD_33190 [Trifolium subterraneum]